MLEKVSFKNNNQDFFWDWFQKKSDVYFHFEQNQNILFSQLKTELNKINDDLVFEFSPILENGKREFVISADGIKSVFPIVLDLVNKAPILSNWDIIAFRQPRKGITQINYDNLTVKFEDIYFRFKKDNLQIALELNIRGFYESSEWTGATFIILDNILGEYYTEMSISSIDKRCLNENEINSLLPIIDLPIIIQQFYLELNINPNYLNSNH